MRSARAALRGLLGVTASVAVLLLLHDTLRLVVGPPPDVARFLLLLPPQTSVGVAAWITTSVAAGAGLSFWYYDRRAWNSIDLERPRNRR